jgi:hypothetical protein
MLTSVGIHALALLFVLLVPVGALGKSTPIERQLDVTFYRPPKVEIPTPAVKLPVKRELPPGGPKPGTPTVKPPEEPNRAAPGDSGKPDLKPGPEAPLAAMEPPKPKIGNTGILAFKEKFASLAQDKASPRLGSDARYTAAANEGRPSTPSVLTTNNPGASGGINKVALNLNVGGGNGGGHGGGPGGDGITGLPVGRAESTIAGIGGGDRPLSHGGPGPSRTDEEIQIVFDRYKAQFYRQYNRALRNDPTLKGQMVLRLTIEPDGGVSMCKLQSSDMNAPDLAAQVVTIVLTINFGAKDGVQALTISYPIDFLPAE